MSIAARSERQAFERVEKQIENEQVAVLVVVCRQERGNICIA